MKCKKDISEGNMGTNYYMRYNVCGCCDRYDEMHIGKKSYGWQFSFQGYKPDYIYSPEGYLGITDPSEIYVSSWKEWQEYLTKEGHYIFNEYDTEISFKEFKAMVENSKKDPKNKNHTTECSNNYYDESFYDKEGYSFNYTDFS